MQILCLQFAYLWKVTRAERHTEKYISRYGKDLFHFDIKKLVRCKYSLFRVITKSNLRRFQRPFRISANIFMPPISSSLNIYFFASAIIAIPRILFDPSGPQSSRSDVIVGPLLFRQYWKRDVPFIPHFPNCENLIFAPFHDFNFPNSDRRNCRIFALFFLFCNIIQIYYTWTVLCIRLIGYIRALPYSAVVVYCRDDWSVPLRDWLSND